MLIWVIALHCEAKPVIDYYRLKKSPSHNAFDLYQSEDMQCVISGIGKINAAAATAWIAALNRNQLSISWLNLGTAGAARHPLGSIYWISKLIQQNTKKHWFPVPTFASGFATSDCISLDQASTDYHDSAIYDMEASAYFSTALRFSSAELVHCLKVISDNQQQKTGLDKVTISHLIDQNITAIDVFVQNLKTLNQQLSKLEIDPDVWRSILARGHFSQTQQARLKTQLRFLLSGCNGYQNLHDKICDLSSSRDILRTLDQLCFEQSSDL